MIYGKCDLCSAERCCTEFSQERLVNGIAGKEPLKLCLRCQKKHLQVCKICGRYVMTLMRSHTEPGGYLSNKYIIIANRVICADCNQVLADKIFQCARCSGTHFVDNMHISNIDDKGVCTNCYAGEGIHVHNYRPRWLFYSKGKTPKANPLPGELYMGIELEVEAPSEASNALCFAADLRKNYSNKEREFVIEHDGSLNNGFEIVTFPRTLENWNVQGKKILTPVLRTLRGARYKAQNSPRCGFHVHCSRSAITPNVLANILYFFYHNWSEMLIFSRRKDKEQWEKYARETIELSSELNTSLTSKCTADICKHLADGREEQLRPRRYSAVNIENRDTIEFRIFQGTLMINTVIATLQFLSSLIKISTRTEDIVPYTFTDIVQYADDSRYNELLNYIALKELDEFI